MWKKSFIRLIFVLLVATTGLLVVAAANKKILPVNTDCVSAQEKCTTGDENSQADFLIWESWNRAVMSAVQF